MNDGDAVGRPRLDAASGRPFEDHDNRSGKQTGPHRSTNPLHERPGGPRSIPPPAIRSRSDNVRRIDEKHYPSLAEPAVRQRSMSGRGRR